MSLVVYAPKPLLPALTTSKICEYFQTVLHHHTNHIFSLSSRLLGFIWMVTFFSLQLSDAWNTSTSTDGRTIEQIRQKFLSLCHLEYNYVNVIYYFKFQSFKFRGVIKCAFFFYLMITVVQNLALHLWKHSIFMCKPRFSLCNGNLKKSQLLFH
jgi:hypothetical protein